MQKPNQTKLIDKKQGATNTNVGEDKVPDHPERGITLIALVITIIVLLILAGVTIAMVLGPNAVSYTHLDVYKRQVVTPQQLQPM